MTTAQKYCLACIFGAVVSILLGTTYGNVTSWGAIAGWGIGLLLLITATFFAAKATKATRYTERA